MSHDSKYGRARTNSRRTAAKQPPMPEYTADDETPAEVHKRFRFEKDWIDEVETKNQKIPVIGCLRARVEPNKNKIRCQHNSLEIRKIIDNAMQADLIVTERNGLSYRLPGTRDDDGTPGFITIKTEVTGPAEMVVAALERYSKQYNLDTDESAAINRHLTDGFGILKYASICIIYTISEHHLEKVGSKMYSDELDMVFEIIQKSQHKKVLAPHPAAPDIRHADQFKDIESKIGKQDVIIGINLVDNSNTNNRSPRYIKLGETVHKVTPTPNPAMEDGMYITTNKSYIKESDKFTDKVRVNYYTYSEADEVLGTRMSIEEALNGESSTNIHKLLTEKETAEHKYNEAVHKNKESKRKAKEETGKNILEWVKVGLGIITAAVSLFTLVSKLTR